jgi:hypothetical protein
MVTICTMCFDVEISLNFPATLCSYIFARILTKNSEYFSMNIHRLVFVRETQFPVRYELNLYVLCR